MNGRGIIIYDPLTDDKLANLLLGVLGGILFSGEAQSRPCALPSSPIPLKTPNKQTVIYALCRMIFLKKRYQNDLFTYLFA